MHCRAAVSSYTAAMQFLAAAGARPAGRTTPAGRDNFRAQPTPPDSFKYEVLYFAKM